MNITTTAFQFRQVNALAKNENSAAKRKNEIQEKIRAQEREMKLRETEDKRIAELRKNIQEVSDSGMNQDIKKAKISSLTDQISSIYEGRAEREKQALELEMEKRLREAEDAQREREKANEKQKPPSDDPEKDKQRIDAKELVRLSISSEGLQAMKQTKARMASEATQLRHDIENDTGLIQIGYDTTIRVKTGFEDTDSFKVSHYTDLQEGISGLDSAMRSRVYGSYKEAAHWQEMKDKVDEKAEKEDQKDNEDQPEEPNV